MEREHMSTNPTHRQHLLGKLLLLYFQGGRENWTVNYNSISCVCLKTLYNFTKS